MTIYSKSSPHLNAENSATGAKPDVVTNCTSSTRRRPFPVVAALIIRDGSVLIAKRPLTAKFGAGLWEFPGGKIDFGEKPEESLSREISEELDCQVQVEDILSASSHVDAAYDLHIVLLSYICRLKDPKLDPVKNRSPKMEAADVRWIALDQLPELVRGAEVAGVRLQDFAKGDHEPLKILAARR